MASIGYALSSEEHAPRDLVDIAVQAEEAGFEFVSISDHFHPWVDRQGHSPFVWGVIGAIAQATQRIRLGTGVTCPLVRTHPAIIAHASATAGCLMPGRFFLGVGTGEALNEHITGAPWPALALRQEMLEEAIEVIRQLWSGEVVTYRGRYYQVEHARLYDVPQDPSPIIVAGSGEKSAQLAGRGGDGFWSTAPQSDLVQAFSTAGGQGKPIYGQVTVCWDEDEAAARKLAHEIWPNAGIPGQLGQDLPTPQHFEQTAGLVQEEDVAERVVCGPDPERHRQAIEEFLDAGFDHVYVHQVGSNQRGYMEFFRSHVMPKL